MSDTRKDAPEFIYLQDGAHDGEIDGPSEYDSGEVTWSGTRIYGDDTKYIRHDKHITLTAELARVKAERDAALQELAETNSAFSEAVHAHQQERAALSALYEKAEAERDAALQQLALIQNTTYTVKLSP